jgi:phospholipid/cholesterol/gamma-HCH transport system ATP-binding protein
MSQPLIQFKNIFKKFGALRVLEGVSLCIYQGEITAIIGKSGEGKSVLLKHMIGLMHPDAGEIVLDGRPISKLKPSEMDKLRGKFSYVFRMRPFSTP